jgi:hypothetical protein
MLNRVIKISLFIVVIGVVLSTIGVVVIGQDFESIVARYNKDDEFTFVSQSSTSNTTKIIVQGINRKIIVVPTLETEITLEYYESEKDYFEYSDSNGIIHLKNKVKWPQVWLFPNWLSPHITVVTVYIPESFSGNIELSSTNGAIEATDLPQINSIKASTTNGSVSFKRLDVLTNLFANTTNGNVLIEDSIVVGSIDAGTTNGQVSSTRNTSNTILLESTNGAIVVQQRGVKETYKIDVRTTNGKIRLDGLIIGSQVLNSSQTSLIKARTTNGNITISFSE